MFKNIGRKIKILARIMTVIGMILSFLIGMIMMLSDVYMVLPGILVVVIGMLSSWISSFLLYGFGEIIDNSEKIVDLLSER